MNLGAPPSALRRKIGAARAPVAVPPMTLARAWRLALVHGFSDSAGLALTVADLRCATVDPPDMPALMEPGDLAVLVEGDHGFGVALLDVQLMAALLEAQTMGRVLPRPALARPPTATDGAMVADPLDRVLTLLEGHARGIDGAHTCGGMRFATPLPDGRAVMLALPDEAHLLHEIALTFGGAGRMGRLRMILPVRAAAPTTADGSAPDPDWHDRIERNLMAAQADLLAVLARLPLPIERITAWQPGDTLLLSPRALGQVALTTCTGTVVARGRLGQAGGHKAVLLDTLAEPDTPAALPAPGSGPGGLLTGKAPFARR